jgi:hypothetical protein
MAIDVPSVDEDQRLPWLEGLNRAEGTTECPTISPTHSGEEPLLQQLINAVDTLFPMPAY